MSRIALGVFLGVSLTVACEQAGNPAAAQETAVVDGVELAWNTKTEACNGSTTTMAFDEDPLLLVVEVGDSSAWSSVDYARFPTEIQAYCTTGSLRVQWLDVR